MIMERNGTFKANHELRLINIMPAAMTHSQQRRIKPRIASCGMVMPITRFAGGFGAERRGRAGLGSRKFCGTAMPCCGGAAVSSNEKLRSEGLNGLASSDARKMV